MWESAGLRYGHKTGVGLAFVAGGVDDPGCGFERDEGPDDETLEEDTMPADVELVTVFMESVNVCIVPFMN